MSYLYFFIVRVSDFVHYCGVKVWSLIYTLVLVISCVFIYLCQPLSYCLIKLVVLPGVSGLNFPRMGQAHVLFLLFSFNRLYITEVWRLHVLPICVLGPLGERTVELLVTRLF